MPEKEDNPLLTRLRSFFTKEKVLVWLKELLKKEAVKRILGTAVGGFKLFLFLTAFNYVWKKFIGPGVKYSFRKIKTFFNSIKYTKKAKRLEDAKTEDEFDSAVDDLP